MFLTHHAGVLLSHPGVLLSHPGVLLSHPGVLLSHPDPPLPIALVPMLSYTTELLFYDDNNNNNNISSINYTQTTIIFRIIDGTIRFNNVKIQTRTWFNMCPS